MRKFFTLISLLLSLTAAQAQVTVTRGGKVVTDGDVLTFAAEDNGVPGLFASWEAGGHDDPTFTAEVDGKLRAYVKVTKTFTGGYSKLQICGLTGSCVNFGKSNILNLSREMKEGESVHMGMEAHFNEGVYGEYETSVDVYFAEQIGEKEYKKEVKLLTYKAVYTYTDPAGIEGVRGAAAEKAVFDGGALHFTLPAAAGRKVEVYDGGGRLVKSAALNGSGSISLKALRPGAYVYSLKEAERRVAGGKVVVK